MPIIDGSKLSPHSEEYKRRLEVNFITKEEWKDPKQRPNALNRVRRAMEAPFVVRSELIRDIGRQVRERREMSRLTASELQEASGINRAEISKLENGKLNPTIEFLERIAAAMNMSVRVEFVRNKKQGA